MRFFSSAAAAAALLRSPSDAGGGSAFTPFAETVTLLINDFVSPTVFQNGYLKLAVAANADGDLPAIVPPANAGAGQPTSPTVNMVANTGADAATAPYVFTYDSVGCAPGGTWIYTVVNDGVTQGTLTISTATPAPQELAPVGSPVVQPLGTPLPTTF